MKLKNWALCGSIAATAFFANGCEKAPAPNPSSTTTTSTPPAEVADDAAEPGDAKADDAKAEENKTDGGTAMDNESSENADASSSDTSDDSPPKIAADTKPEVVAPAAEPAGFSPGIEIGETVPEFSLSDQAGKARSLSDLVGSESKYVALVFYRSADW
jgi:hypothetical protein